MSNKESKESVITTEISSELADILEETKSWVEQQTLHTQMISDGGYLAEFFEDDITNDPEGHQDNTELRAELRVENEDIHLDSTDILLSKIEEEQHGIDEKNNDNVEEIVLNHKENGVTSVEESKELKGKNCEEMEKGEELKDEAVEKLDQIEKEVEKLDQVEKKIEKLDGIDKEIEKSDEFEKKVEKSDQVEKEIEKWDQSEKEVDTKDNTLKSEDEVNVHNVVSTQENMIVSEPKQFVSIETKRSLSIKSATSLTESEKMDRESKRSAMQDSKRVMSEPANLGLNRIPSKNRITCAVEVHREKSVTPTSVHREKSVTPTSVHREKSVTPSSVHREKSVTPSSVAEWHDTGAVELQKQGTDLSSPRELHYFESSV
jgi:protein CLEC16A